MNPISTRFVKQLKKCPKIEYKINYNEMIFKNTALLSEFSVVKRCFLCEIACIFLKIYIYFAKNTKRGLKKKRLCDIIIMYICNLG